MSISVDEGCVPDDTTPAGGECTITIDEEAEEDGVIRGSFSGVVWVAATNSTWPARST